jgi:predicted Zn-dependent protease
MAAGEYLNGHYRYDQEGAPAQPAVLVEDGAAINISNYATGNDDYTEEIENHPDAPQIMSAELWCDYVDC